MIVLNHVVPTSDVDPFGDEFLTDPFPALDQLREGGPVVFLARYGVWAVAGYEHVHAVLRDNEHFSSAAGVGLTDLATERPWRKPSILLEVDPPIHTRNRGVVAGALSPRVLRSLQDTFDAAASSLVQELLDREHVDGVADLAEVFPTVVFPKAFGVGADAREHLLAYGSLVFNGHGPRNRLFERALAESGEALEWVTAQCQRDALRSGSIGAAIYAAADAAGLDESDTALLIRSFLSAGVDTTASGLAFALYRLATNPDQWEALRADPNLARGAFEETIRIDSPVIGFFRTTTTEAAIDGVAIPAHSKVQVFYAGANRDPRRWDEPDRYDIGRHLAGHLGYGFGPHVCVGMAIARMEGQAVLRALATGAQRLELTGPPTPRLNNTLRNLDTLPLSIS